MSENQSKDGVFGMAVVAVIIACCIGTCKYNAIQEEKERVRREQEAIERQQEEANREAARRREQARREAAMAKPVSQWTAEERVAYAKEYEELRQKALRQDPTLWTESDKKKDRLGYCSVLLESFQSREARIAGIIDHHKSTLDNVKGKIKTQLAKNNDRKARQVKLSADIRAGRFPIKVMCEVSVSRSKWTGWALGKYKNEIREQELSDQSSALEFLVSEEQLLETGEASVVRYKRTAQELEDQLVQNNRLLRSINAKRQKLDELVQELSVQKDAEMSNSMLEDVLCDIPEIDKQERSAIRFYEQERKETVMVRTADIRMAEDVLKKYQQ